MNLLGEKKEFIWLLSVSYPFIWWKFILQGINIFTWCHLGLPNNNCRNQVAYDNSNCGELANRYEPAALSACRSEYEEGSVHLIIRDSKGKLQRCISWQCAQLILRKGCVLFGLRGMDGEKPTALQNGPRHLWCELRVLHAFLHEHWMTCISMSGLRVSSMFSGFFISQNTFLRS